MLEKLFESLDENVFTAELKESLEAQFNEAVEAKAAIIADEKIEEATDSLNEKSEAHIDFLNEKADQYVAQKQSEMVDSLDKYLDRVVEEIVYEAKDAINENVKSEKADMIIEAFDSMLTATGVEVAKIVEAKDDSAVENKLEESVAKYDSLVEELIALKDENETLIKMGVISELKEGLSIVEAEKFVKLAGLVEFTKDEAFAEKLETIKESVKGAVEAKEEELTETVDQDGESKEAPAWAHLV
jgi:flagellar hook protein FlgE